MNEAMYIPSSDYAKKAPQSSSILYTGGRILCEPHYVYIYMLIKNILPIQVIILIMQSHC